MKIPDEYERNPTTCPACGHVIHHVPWQGKLKRHVCGCAVDRKPPLPEGILVSADGYLFEYHALKVAS